MRSNTLVLGAALMLLSFAGFSCNRYDTNPAEVPDPDTDEQLVETRSESAGAESAGEEASGDEAAADHSPRQIVLAGGCFWCVEAVYQELAGVLDVESGYAGGDEATANYRAVTTGRTGHAEAVRITYDPTKITYGTILKVFFTTAHDPTTLNRQGADVGPQYRSAIFYANDEQKQVAKDYIDKLNAEDVFRSKIVTTLEPLEKFYVAETYHQDYADQNPNDGYILGVSKPKVDKTKKSYPELLKDGE